MKPFDIEKELERLSLMLSIEQRKNTLAQRYVRKLRVILANIRELRKLPRGGRL